MTVEEEVLPEVPCEIEMSNKVLSSPQIHDDGSAVVLLIRLVEERRHKLKYRCVTEEKGNTTQKQSEPKMCRPFPTQHSYN